MLQEEVRALKSIVQSVKCPSTVETGDVPDKKNVVSQREPYEVSMFIKIIIYDILINCKKCCNFSNRMNYYELIIYERHEFYG